MVRFLLAGALALAGALVPAGAQALYIDFTSSAWSGADGVLGSTGWSVTYADVGTVTVTSAPAGSRLYQDSMDGLGVNHSLLGYEYDEVDTDELLMLTFEAGPQMVNFFDLTDFFHENGYYETGYYSLDGDTPVLITADDVAPWPSSNGEKQVNLGGVSVQSIFFTAPGLTNCDAWGHNCENHEFSLAGVDVRPTGAPEPSSLILMGSGLTGLALLRRRRERRRDDD